MTICRSSTPSPTKKVVKKLKASVDDDESHVEIPSFDANSDSEAIKENSTDVSTDLEIIKKEPEGYTLRRIGEYQCSIPGNEIMIRSLMICRTGNLRAEMARG